jgi:hypothetical protein
VADFSATHPSWSSSSFKPGNDLALVTVQKKFLGTVKGTFNRNFVNKDHSVINFFRAKDYTGAVFALMGGFVN